MLMKVEVHNHKIYMKWLHLNCFLVIGRRHGINLWMTKLETRLIVKIKLHYFIYKKTYFSMILVCFFAQNWLDSFNTRIIFLNVSNDDTNCFLKQKIYIFFHLQKDLIFHYFRMLLPSKLIRKFYQNRYLAILPEHFFLQGLYRHYSGKSQCIIGYTSFRYRTSHVASQAYIRSS